VDFSCSFSIIVSVVIRPCCTNGFQCSGINVSNFFTNFVVIIPNLS
jgi:hypothetical protein